MENMFDNELSPLISGGDNSQKVNFSTEDKVVTMAIEDITIPDIHLNLYESQNKSDKLLELK
jgi:hypothetical protein